MKGISITRFMALTAALLALALVGFGCGSDDGGSGGDAEAEITAVVEESVAFEDPATICEENFTDAALEENFEGKDREAQIEDCNKESPSELTDIEVAKVEVDGEAATAKVSVQPEEAEEAATLTIELVDEDGWKIDSVR